MGSPMDKIHTYAIAEEDTACARHRLSATLGTSPPRELDQW